MRNTFQRREMGNSVEAVPKLCGSTLGGRRWKTVRKTFLSSSIALHFACSCSSCDHPQFLPGFQQQVSTAPPPPMPNSFSADQALRHPWLKTEEAQNRSALLKHAAGNILKFQAEPKLKQAALMVRIHNLKTKQKTKVSWSPSAPLPIFWNYDL